MIRKARNRCYSSAATLSIGFESGHGTDAVQDEDEVGGFLRRGVGIEAMRTRVLVLVVCVLAVAFSFVGGALLTKDIVRTWTASVVACQAAHEACGECAGFRRVRHLWPIVRCEADRT